MITRLIPILLLLNMSCNNSVSYEEAMSDNQDRFEDAEQLADARFLVDAKSRNMLAVNALSLASDSAYSSIVVTYAKQALTDHETLQDEIQDISKKKDVSLADELSADHQILLTELSSASRQDFDNIFSKIIGRVNDENQSAFTVQATQASDPDIRAFAARKLDILRKNSQSVNAMQGQLMKTSD